MMLPVSITLLVLMGMVDAEFNEELYQSIKNQTEVIMQLQKDGYVSNKRVMNTMSQFDIKIFEGVHIYLPLYAYVLERLEKHIQEGDKVLIVEPGSGYLAACMVILTDTFGYVVASSEKKANLDFTEKIFWHNYRRWLHTKRILFVENDSNIFIAFAPYSAVYIADSDESVVPYPVSARALDKLGNGGRLMMPIKSEDGNFTMRIYDRDKDGKTSFFEEQGVFEKIHYPKL